MRLLPLLLFVQFNRNTAAAVSVSLLLLKEASLSSKSNMGCSTSKASGNAVTIMAITNVTMTMMIFDGVILFCNPITAGDEDDGVRKDGGC